MRDWLAPIGIVVLVVGLAVVGIFWGRWEYRECKHVGHSTAYCLTHSGNDR